LLKEKKYKEAAELLDERIRKDPENARNYYLRALACIPGLNEGYPKDLDPQAFAAASLGWGLQNETMALGYLDRALRAKSGKGDTPQRFDSDLRLLAAKVHAKRFVCALSFPGYAWVDPYNRSAQEAKAANQADPTNLAVVPFAEALKNRLPPEVLKLPPPAPPAKGAPKTVIRK
jgi:hypothetical protein